MATLAGLIYSSLIYKYVVESPTEDAPPQIEGVHAPRMSGRERRGVSSHRLIEIMAAAGDVEDGGAPPSYVDALNGPQSGGWKRAFAAEVKSLDDNKVYTVVDRPFGKEVVKAKWVLRRKLLPRGKLDKLKLTHVVTSLPIRIFTLNTRQNNTCH